MDSRALEAFIARNRLDEQAAAELRALAGATPGGLDPEDADTDPGGSADQTRVLSSHQRDQLMQSLLGEVPAGDLSAPTRVAGAAQPQPISGAPPLLLPDERYQLLELLGRGGMGEVRRVRDGVFDRILAMKILTEEPAPTRAGVARFIEEARVAAQLEHPGLVPVHDLGRLVDGRLFFTMKEVEGRTFGEIIREVHDARVGGEWRPSPTGWTLHRLIDALHRVCEAVAYAHARGVIHRDLKPANIMIGSFGEVLVVDWGLARRVGAPGDPGDDGAGPLSGDRPDGLTLQGEVAGTPAYMPPEQARGELDRLGPAADVYALGAVLYAILSGRPPYGQLDQKSTLFALLRRPPDPFEPELAASTPQALRELCMAALSREPEDRPADAGILAAELGAWLEGARRRQQALAQVEEVAGRLRAATALRQRAAETHAEGAAALDALPAWAAADAKRPGWARLDEAQALLLQAELEEVAWLQGMRGALEQDPDLPQAHQQLAAFYERQHRLAELTGDARQAARMEALLRAHDRAGRHRAYLDGDGWISLDTDPPQAEVFIYALEDVDRRLVPRAAGTSLLAPLASHQLPRGRYLLELRSPARATARIPLQLGRQRHWLHVAPGEEDPRPIPLPSRGAVGEGAEVIPEGWFIAGGDREAPGAMERRRVWVEGFAMARYPVTHQQYLAFLNDLVSQGRALEALRHAPREQGAPEGDARAVLYAVGDRGRMSLRADLIPRLGPEDAPVTFVSWLDGLAYAAWLAGRTGHPWRLPGELEWEKAARGTDGRLHPWGDAFDPSLACMSSSHRAEPVPVSVRAFEADESPYGIRGLGGNVATWCLDRFRAGGPELEERRYRLPGFGDDRRALSPGERQGGERVIRGGSWLGGAARCRSASRDHARPEARWPTVGIRLVAGLGG